MTENPHQDKELKEKPSDAASREDSVPQLTGEKTQPGLNIVKSIIREKQSPRTGLEEEDTVGALKAPKMSGNKLSKFAKYKRGRSKSNERNDSDIGVDKKEENLEPSDQPGSLPSEENAQLSETHAKSKNSLVQAKLQSKNSTSFVAEDEDLRTDSSKALETRNSLKEESKSTFIMSHDAETQREENVNVPTKVLETEADSSPVKSTSSQRSVHERGNYMNNVSPAYIEDYPAEDDRKSNQSGNK